MNEEEDVQSVRTELETALGNQLPCKGAVKLCDVPFDNSTSLRSWMPVRVKSPHKRSTVRGYVVIGGVVRQRSPVVFVKIPRQPIVALHPSQVVEVLKPDVRVSAQLDETKTAVLREMCGGSSGRHVVCLQA